MRYSPLAFALGVLGLLSASTGRPAAPAPLSPRAAVLEVQGRAALAGAAVETATDDFEAALALDPDNPALLLDLGAAARRDGMQGKALHYYRMVLAGDPQNLMAISGEGAALAEKGALDKARRNLAELQNLCGTSCEATRQLADVLAHRAEPQVLAADAAKPKAEVSRN